MATILVLQHHPDEGLGSLAWQLAEYDHDFDVRELDQGESVPSSLDPYAALIVMGGPMSVHDEAEYPWLQAEKNLIRMAAAENVPTLGHCLGAQLIAVSLGGSVERNPSGQELGWWPVRLTEAGRALWPELPAEFPLFHWHGEQCTALPPEAQVLAYNTATTVQAFTLGDRILALQAHPEVTAAQVRQWLQDGTAALAEKGRFVQPATDMLRDLDAEADRLAATAAALYRPWLEQIERHG
ncbi:type 1 glutamine amidotransferase [Acidithiobacillus sp. AMEEHan]|uniref:type 1 glutamine amidotransferase n=1 Tax=Acidithiobacillus sp. AMEEHan TaxID=2994951 RepID=UPI0027E3EE7F|nr:type 1 glutamine amidotransferase [Acidithiobacillus sp. AMEEHan]